MKVSVIGAAGSCGQAIVHEILSRKLLGAKDALQLVGNALSSRPELLYGLQCDLEEAFYDNIPEISVTVDKAEICGEIVIFAAGSALSTNPNTLPSKVRAGLAEVNLPIFQSYAKALSQNYSKHPLIIVLTNPVELAVDIFSDYFPRDCVVGSGLHLDGLRLRQEIALELGVSRSSIKLSVVGEHSLKCIPLWSTFESPGSVSEETLRQGGRLNNYFAKSFRALGKIMDYLKEGQVALAIQFLRSLPVDVRAPLKPIINHYSGAKTAIATARATVDLLATALGARTGEISATVQLEGEEGLSVPFGMPIELGRKIYKIKSLAEIRPEERKYVFSVAKDLRKHLDQWRGVPSKL